MADEVEPYDFGLEAQTYGYPPVEVEGKELERRREDTRRWLAFALVATFAIVVLVALGAVVLGGTSVDDIKSILEVLIPPLVALTGSALGFYFGSRESSS